MTITIHNQTRKTSGQFLKLGQETITIHKDEEIQLKLPEKTCQLKVSWSRTRAITVTDGDKITLLDAQPYDFLQSYLFRLIWAGSFLIYMVTNILNYGSGHSLPIWAILLFNIGLFVQYLFPAVRVIKS